MAMIFRPPRTRQPQVAVGPNLASRFAEKLWVAYTAPVVGAKSVDGRKTIVGVDSSSMYANGISSMGRSLYGNGASLAASKGTFGTAGDMPFHSASEMSCFAVVEFASLSSASETAIFRAATPSNQGIALDFFPSTKTIRPLIATTGSSGWSASYDEQDTSIVIGIPWGLGFTYISGRRVTYSGPIGRAPKTFVRSAITGVMNDSLGTSSKPYYGGMEHSASSTGAFPGHINAFYAAGIALTEIEMVALFLSPWRIFAPQNRNLFAFAAAAGGSTWNLDPTSASHLHSAASASIVLGLQLVPDNSAIAQAVTQAAIQLGITYNPAGAAHAHSVGSPDVALGYTLSPASASHLHVVSTVEISVGTLLAPDSTSHSQLVDAVNLQLAYMLAPAAASHNQSVSPSTLQLAYSLAADNTSHTTAVAAAAISISGTGGTGTVQVPSLLINTETGDVFKVVWATLN